MKKGKYNAFEEPVFGQNVFHCILKKKNNKRIMNVNF